MKLTKQHVRKILTIVDCGLTSGLGEPKPGHLCVEAAISLALGLPHGDNPPCVGKAVRDFKITLNDSAWSSDAARAKGLRKISIAQLGSNEIDQARFSELMVIKTCNRLLPRLLRQTAQLFDGEHQENLLKAAKDCEGVTTADAARSTADAARSTAAAARSTAAAASYTAAAASYAAYAASHTAYAARHTAYAASYAADAARYTAAAASYTAAAARSTADAARSTGKKIADALSNNEALTLCADICLDVLIELKSPGCKWLSLCD